MWYNHGMEFTQLDVADFEKFVVVAPGANFMQSRQMYEKLTRQGREVYLLGVKDGHGKTVAAGIVMNMGTRRGLGKIFGVPMGPLLDFSGKKWREILKIWTAGARDFLRTHGGMALEITPHAVVTVRNYENETIREVHPEIRGVLSTFGYKNVGEVGQIKWEYVLNLDGRTEQEIFESFRKDIRTRIKQATTRYGVRVRDLEYDELSVMEEMTDEASSMHGFTDKDLKYYQEMWQAFGSDVKFVVAEVPVEVAEGSVARLDLADAEIRDSLSGEFVPISAVMYMTYGPEVLSLFSGVTHKYPNVGGCSHLIRWELIRYALNHGYLRYDFYGVQPVEGNSVYNFKAGFRGEIEELVGTHVLPLNLRGKAYVSRMKYREFGKF